MANEYDLISEQRIFLNKNKDEKSKTSSKNVTRKIRMQKKCVHLT